MGGIGGIRVRLFPAGGGEGAQEDDGRKKSGADYAFSFPLRFKVQLERLLLDEGPRGPENWNGKFHSERAFYADQRKMMEIVGGLVLAGVLVGFIFMIRPLPDIHVVVADGRAEAKRGKVSQGFLSDCLDVAGMEELKGFWVKGYRRKGGRMELRFPSWMEEGVCQRLRNAWGFHR